MAQVYATPEPGLEFQSSADRRVVLDANRGFAEDGGMALQMRASCEKCGAPLDGAGDAFICSYECTFCPRCAESMRYACPNCGGELVRRPPRVQAAAP